MPVFTDHLLLLKKSGRCGTVSGKNLIQRIQNPWSKRSCPREKLGGTLHCFGLVDIPYYSFYLLSRRGSSQVAAIPGLLADPRQVALDVS